jgi:hypothetical protein
MDHWIKKFYAIGVLYILAVTPSFAASNADVKAGHLELVKTDDSEYTLRLNSRPVHKIEDAYAEITRVFKGVGGKDIVLLSSNAGGSGTGDFYELVMITPQGQVTATESFGTGRRPKIIQQGQKIVFLFAGGEKWVYESGVIREEKATKDMPLSDKDCKEVFDVYMTACAKEQSCTEGKPNFPMVYERTINYYAQRISLANFDSLCLQACGGKVADYQVFKARVCKR